MSSPIAHAAAGYAVYTFFRERLPTTPVFGLPHCLAWPIAAMAFAMIPDIDTGVACIMGSMTRFHNNLSHSLLVCTLASLLLTPFLRFFTRTSFTTGLAFILTCCYSHILIDLLTISRGVMLFWPWTERRFLSPVSLFVGVPWSSSLTNPYYLLMLVNDLCFAIAILALTEARRLRKKGSGVGGKG